MCKIWVELSEQWICEVGAHDSSVSTYFETLDMCINLAIEWWKFYLHMYDIVYIFSVKIKTYPYATCQRMEEVY